MTLDAGIVGLAGPAVEVTVGVERLKAFAAAIGETDPVYSYSAAAVIAGYPDIPAPPTYHFSLGLERERPLGFLEDSGVDMLRLLHGEQHFAYHRMIFAGDVVSVSGKVVDFYERKGGALQFIVMETAIRDLSGEPVSTGRETLVLPARPPERNAVTALAAAPPAPGVWRLLRCGPVTRELLARFGPASGDLNPVHLDPDAAKSAGYDDVFAHGMLSMAWLGRLLTGMTRQENIRSFGVRFHAITPLGAEPVCEGWGAGAGEARETGAIDLGVRLGDGTVTLSGQAVIGAAVAVG